MSHSHDHDDESLPFLWEVFDSSDRRITILVKHTEAEALALAAQLMGARAFRVVNTGKRKPPNKCCTTCGDKPCS